MTGDEYLANEPEIMAQLQSIGVPTESELHTASLKEERFMLDHIPEVMEPKSEDIIELYNFETE